VANGKNKSEEEEITLTNFEDDEDEQDNDETEEQLNTEEGKSAITDIEAPTSTPSEENVLKVNLDALDQKAPEPKKVRIRVKRHITPSIGGQRYDLHPNKEHLVPANVKEILLNAGVLEAY
jgi:hypothetical protein